LPLNPDGTVSIQVVDFDAREKGRAQILQLVKKKDPASVEFLHGYVREGMPKFSFGHEIYFGH